MLATGNPGGVFDVYGTALATVLARRLPAISVETLNTDASVANARMVASGEADLGFALGDTAADAVRGEGGFPRPLGLLALTRTYDSFVHLIVRAGVPIAEIADLRGQRVGIGPRDSGTRVVALRLLRLAGLRIDQVRTTGASLQDDADAIAAGRLDAFFFVSGLPNSAVAALVAEASVSLVSMRDLVEPLVEEYGPQYVTGPIPASTYAMPESTDSVSVKNYLLANPEVPSAVGYAVTRVLFEAQDEIAELASDVRQPTVAAGIFTSPIDLHPGSVRYFRGLRGG